MRATSTAPAAPVDLSAVVLTSGGHRSPTHGTCAMEVVSMLARERFSDHPACACPVLGAFARRLNDAWWPSDEARTDALRPVLSLLLNTRSTREVEHARRLYLVDCALRWYAPLALMAAVVALELQGRDICNVT
ncbi:MAG: hypothetical protein ACEQSX_10760 [Baekduiaceae bacterium]